MINKIRPSQRDEHSLNPQSSILNPSQDLKETERSFTHSSQHRTKNHIQYWFYLFLSVHVLVWSLLPTLLRYTLPLDAMEGTTWGRQLFLGYDKNPFLNAWLTELAVWLGGKSGWLIYAFGQLCVVATFWAVWRLGKKVVHPAYALIAVLILEGMTNYNIDAIDFDDNVLLLMFWALIISYFYSAIKSKSTKDWVYVGLFAGLAMMAKYFVVILFLPMALFLILNQEARDCVFHRGFYLAVVAFFIVVLPHFIWLCFHHFVTIHYAFVRTTTDETFITILKAVGQFVTSYVSAFLVPLFLFCIMTLGKTKGEVLAERHPLSRFDRQYLWVLGAGPFIFVLLLSLTKGMVLHFGWGQPLSTFWGLMVVALIQPVVTVKKFHRFLIVLAVLMTIGAIGYAYSMMTLKGISANYPGPVMAKQITQEWDKRYHSKLYYIIGPRFTAGVVSFYSTDRPAVYMEADPQASFWIDENEIRQKGAVVLWDADQAPLSLDWKRRFPSLVGMQVKAFPWMRSHVGDAPISVGVAFLPPGS